MKHLAGALFLFLFLSPRVSGQHMQVANPIIIPESPKAGDSVFVRLRSMTTSVTVSNGYVQQRIADSFNIHHCVRGFILLAVKSYDDTLFLGVLDTGNYVVHFTMYATSRGDTCEYLIPHDSTTYFKVSPATSLVSYSIDEFRVYPNPSHGELNLTGIKSTLGVVTLSIYQVDGKRVHSQELPLSGGTDAKLKLEGFPNGLYFLELQDGVNRRRMKVVIK
ncbi:MAG: T9SS type A sorting domain-containing protein [Bacteroidota bacterium]|nr:T9SS type A sorting domain-containing protein [Bacteroidota bacterium]MDX5430171.1 T9SS type A sorting domain-containing protein [Bacteroidota bacterium]